MRKIVNLTFVLNMLPTEFEFTSQDDAREFAVLMQKSAVKNMKKVLKLPEGLTDQNPTVPGFEIIGTPEGMEHGFLLGEIPATFKVRGSNGAATSETSTETSEDDDKTDTEDDDELSEKTDDEIDDETEVETPPVAPAPTAPRTTVRPKGKK
jgi:hypothetical protein